MFFGGVEKVFRLLKLNQVENRCRKDGSDMTESFTNTDTGGYEGRSHLKQ